MKNTKKYNLYGTICWIENDNLYLNDKIIDKQEMQEIINDSKGMNRIYKPLPLLFYIDCKAGKEKNYECFLIN